MSTDPEPTPGELAVLRAYLEAGTAKAAARLLRRSEATVTNQLRSLRSRLGVTNTAQAVAVLGLRLHRQTEQTSEIAMPNA